MRSAHGSTCKCDQTTRRHPPCDRVAHPRARLPRAATATGRTRPRLWERHSLIGVKMNQVQITHPAHLQPSWPTTSLSHDPTTLCAAFKALCRNRLTRHPMATALGHPSATVGQGKSVSCRVHLPPSSSPRRPSEKKRRRNSVNHPPQPTSAPVHTFSSLHLLDNSSRDRTRTVLRVCEPIRPRCR